MKLKSFVALGILISGVAVAITIKAWQPVVFSLTANPLQETIEIMRQEGDSVLIDIEKDNPTFQKKFSESFAQYLKIALNSVVLPMNLAEVLRTEVSEQDREENQTVITYATARIGKIIKNFEIYTVGSFIKELESPEKPNLYKYKYCEANLGHAEFPCSENEVGNQDRGNFFDNNSREYVFVRRLFSHPTFVSEMCPVITPFAVWYLNWTWWPGQNTSEKKAQVMAPIFYRIHALLDSFYGDGKWNHSNITKYFSDYLDDSRFQDLDPQLVGLVGRRYLDGGPELMMSYRSCLSLIETALAEHKTTTSSDASIEIQRQIKFEMDPALKLEIASFKPFLPSQNEEEYYAPTDYERVYRLTHQYKMLQPVPPQFLISDDEHENFEAYLVTVKFGLSDTSMLSLVASLNNVDSLYKYRLLTYSEFNSLALEKQNEMKKGNLCFFDQDIYKLQSMDNFKIYHYNAWDKQFTERTTLESNYCSLNWTIVREKRF